MTSAERHAKLCAQIAEHDHRYYVLDAPTISDAAYDAIFRELRDLEAAHPELVTPASPTQRVGGKPREGVSKIEHEHPMYSLDNAYSENELREFDRRVREGLGAPEAPVRYVAEPKLDGASIEIVYRDGMLVSGATRGDGKVGEDVTPNVRTIRALPLRVDDRRPLTLRGEVVIYRRDLDAINEARRARDEEPFANTRNAAAGSLRLMDSRETAERPLRVFFYDVVERHWPSHAETLDAIRALGLPSHGLHRACDDVDAVLAHIAAFDKERKKLPYDTDGVVVKVDRLAEREVLGATSRFPRWAIAFKYQAERATTVVRAITCDLGRTGALTPVADLDPVQLAGTTVSRASLHNVDYVADRDVRIGDTVVIEKAGEIIPQVVNVLVARRPPGTHAWRAPTHCPTCGAAVVRAEDEAALRCPNPACPGRKKAGIFHFTRRTAMDVDRLGHALIAQLVDRGLVRDVSDIFALAGRRDELMALERMADKSVDNLLQSIETARTGRALSRLLAGLGIPLVGAVAAGVIAGRYRTLRALLDRPPEALREELGDIHGIGPKIADSVAAFFADPEQRAVAERLLERGVVAEEPEDASGPATGPLAGMSFCVTGTLSKPRGEIHQIIRAHGGTVHERVKQGTTYLVTGEKVGASKRTAAEKFGANVIDEAALMALVTAKT
jgi:DNA ligase (NAD+)